MPLVKIRKAAELLGVSVQTLRKWEDSGELVPDRRSEGGVRYYDMGTAPSERFGTKCPSITSMWIRSAPAADKAHTPKIFFLVRHTRPNRAGCSVERLLKIRAQPLSNQLIQNMKEYIS